MLLTVVVCLSGPHRLDMLTQAMDSLPLDAPELGAVQVLHRHGGRWDWAPELRARYEGHPKVTIIEEPFSLPSFEQNATRALPRVQTDWVHYLHDDDYAVTENFRLALAALPRLGTPRRAFAAFGWYAATRGWFLPQRLAGPSLLDITRRTPKFCSTFLNTALLRQEGGLPTLGGFSDTEVFARLAARHGAWRCDTPIGVYRWHTGQDSFAGEGVRQSYYDTLQASIKAVSDLAQSEAERRQVDAIFTRMAHRQRLLRERIANRVEMMLQRVPEPRSVRALAPLVDMPPRPGALPPLSARQPASARS